MIGHRGVCLQYIQMHRHMFNCSLNRGTLFCFDSLEARHQAKKYVPPGTSTGSESCTPKSKLS
jgi:hypothetical protein